MKYQIVKIGEHFLIRRKWIFGMYKYLYSFGYWWDFRFVNPPPRYYGYSTLENARHRLDEYLIYIENEKLMKKSQKEKERNYRKAKPQVIDERDA